MRTLVLESIRIGQIVQLTFAPLGNAQISPLTTGGEPYGVAADIRIAS